VQPALCRACSPVEAPNRVDARPYGRERLQKLERLCFAFSVNSLNSQLVNIRPRIWDEFAFDDYYDYTTTTSSQRIERTSSLIASNQKPQQEQQEQKKEQEQREHSRTHNSKNTKNYKNT
jgi:hypothetical protein